MLPLKITNPDSKVHGAIMGPIWGRQVPGGAYVGPMNLAIRESIVIDQFKTTESQKNFTCHGVLSHTVPNQ